MKTLFFFLLSIYFLLPIGLISQDNPLWMRYSTISPDGQQIVFTYKGDLFVVASSGGDARQITFHEAHDFMPVWSKDSKKIAFASDRYGNFDIFFMEAAGGAAERLTFHSNDEYPYSFTPDNNKIVFGGVRQDLAEHRQYPTGSMHELYQVPTIGGRIEMLWTIPAEDIQFNKVGSLLIYHDKKGGENEWRKHHQSSIARDIWIYDKEKDSHKMLTEFYGEDRNPVFSPDEKSIYYLSESSGTFNVHKMNIENPEDNSAITQFKDHPVRFLSIADNGLMSFGYDGALYTIREGEKAQKLSIQLVSQDVSNKDSFISINGGVQEMAISPNGKEVAFIARGEVFVTSVDGKMTKRITNTPAQEKFVGFAPDGKSVIYAREEAGKWSIFQTAKQRSEEEPFFFASTLLKESKLINNNKENYLPEYSPDGKKLAYVEDRKTLKVMDLASKESVTLLTSEELFHMRDGDQYFTWSPDSKWLLASYNPTMANGEVVLLDASGKNEKRNLTQSGYNDYYPKWVNDGKQMLWFSNKDGLKSFATSGGSQTDVYSMFFTQEAWDKFQLDKEDFDLQQEIEKLNKKEDEKEDESKKDKKKEKEDKKPEDLKFDWGQLDERKAKFTIHSSSLSDAVLSKDGEKLYYLARFEEDYNLWSTELRTKETKMALQLDAKYGRMMWDKEMKNLFLLSDGSISKIDLEKSKKEPIKISGEMTLNKEAELAYMFEHIWIRTNGIFYTSNMHGVNWDSLKTVYAKFLPHIGNGYEFAEMASEMLGELNASHTGVRYNGGMSNGDATASLGVFVDYNHKASGLKIAEIIKGGPLDKAAFEVKAGSIIEKIDGIEIAPDTDFAIYLNRKADQFTLLQIYNPAIDKRQQITVKPISLGAERRLLYRRWVKQNQEEVKRLSNGKLGYVHIPGMSDGPYRDIYEEMMGKYHDMDGVIVDTRFNGGGDLVADLAMFFTGEKFLTYATEEREVGYEPTFRWTKPTLAMFNEGNYSDGSCFACGYNELNIGKTVGMPVPGTCSFAGWEGLPNGSYWGTVPVSAKNKAGEWLENLEAKPDIEVKNMPGIIAKGRDQQLETAVAELLKDVK
jgi:Tol biopolymer transport system component/C-terminal processing protease CtpA/Prc